MLSYLSRCASTELSVRSLTPTSWMSAPRSSAARKKLRPIRPKPLMPTRMVTRHISLPAVMVVTQPYPRGHSTRREGLRVHRQHLGGDGRFGVRYPQIAGPLVGQREQATD